MQKKFYNLKEAAELLKFKGGRNKFSQFLKDQNIIHENRKANEDLEEKGLLFTTRKYYGRNDYYASYYTMITPPGIEYIKEILANLRKNCSNEF